MRIFVAVAGVNDVRGAAVERSQPCAGGDAVFILNVFESELFVKFKLTLNSPITLDFLRLHVWCVHAIACCVARLKWKRKAR